MYALRAPGETGALGVSSVASGATTLNRDDDVTALSVAGFAEFVR